MTELATPAPSRLLLFARNFFKHPKMLGSLIPSSRFLVNDVLRRMDLAHADTVVEYGPGVGTFTGELLRRMKPDAKLLVIEMNSDFVGFLRRSIPDPRLVVAHGSAADVEKHLREIGRQQANYVISG